MSNNSQKIEKPPYFVPSMDEIRSMPLTGLRAASTFSGCGGSSLGYRMAGFKVVWANEFIPAAADTYRANFPDTPLDVRDIRLIMPGEILAATGLKEGELDLLDGSPPCASFSMNGKRESDWGKVKVYSDTEQRIDDLFFEFARILAGLKPKTFVAENVAGLLYGTAQGYFKEILAALKKAGYKVAVRLVDGQWMGVPQARQRTIFVGVREDLPFEPAHPKPLPYRYTLREAFGADEIPGECTWLKKGNKIYRCWFWSRDNNRPVFDDAHLALYGKKSMYNQRRTSLDAPCPTILQGSTSLYHPEKPRTHTIEELKRISSFPDDFILTGNFGQKWERIGRAVPPLMMKAVAACVRDSILLPQLRTQSEM